MIRFYSYSFPMDAWQEREFVCGGVILNCVSLNMSDFLNA